MLSPQVERAVADTEDIIRRFDQAILEADESSEASTAIQTSSSKVCTKSPGDVPLDTDDLIKKFDAAIAETLADLETSFDNSETAGVASLKKIPAAPGEEGSLFQHGSNSNNRSTRSQAQGTNMNVPTSRTAPDVSDAEIRNLPEAPSDVEIKMAMSTPPALETVASADLEAAVPTENAKRNSINSQTMKANSLASMAPIHEGEILDDNAEAMSPFDTQKLSEIRTEFSGTTPLKRVGTWIEKHRTGKKGRSTMGNIVTKESQSWNFVSALTSGIKSTIRRETMDGHQCGDDLHPIDFHECFKSSTVTPEKGLYKFKDYAPKVFRNLRYFFGVDDKAYLQSIGQDGLHEISTAETGSKSGQKFLISADGRYFMKTITKSECKFFRKILPQYYNHMKNSRNTLLCRFFGLHRIKPGKLHLLVMCNIFDTERVVHDRYDLKGSTVGRQVSEAEKKNPTVILKDLDFIKANGKIVVGADRRQQMMTQVQADCNFLQSIGVMDYSLLLGIHWREKAVDTKEGGSDHRASPKFRTTDLLRRTGSLLQVKREKTHTSIFQEDDGGWCSFQTNKDGPVSGNQIYFMGIIDYLQYYNSRKRAETFVKSFQYNYKEISAVGPQLYASRFCDFISSIVE
mmetsp:Transcript_21416/g.70952  ORF Transcript_21416/g.70952 Transcript_21416/m.70952 type:complete len:629 (-) Transcript_21416:146-2032(-)